MSPERVAADFLDVVFSMEVRDVFNFSNGRTIFVGRIEGAPS
jgi:hypothetical protein